MNEIVLKAANPSEAIQLVSVLLQNGFKPLVATIHCSISKEPSVKLSKVRDFPLILTGTLNGHEMRVAVSQLAVGRPCDGSYALRRILKISHFYFEEKDLFTTRHLNPKTGCINFSLSKR